MSSLLDVPVPLWLYIQSHLHWQERLAHCIPLCRLLPARCQWTDRDHVRLTVAMWEALLDGSRSAAGRLSSAVSLDIGAHIDDVQLVHALVDGTLSPLHARLEQLSPYEPFTALHTLLCSDRVLQCIFDSGIPLPQLHSLCIWPLTTSCSVSSLLYTHRRRLPSLRRLKLLRFSLFVHDHRQLLGLPSLELLDISRCSWSARDSTLTVLSLPEYLTHLLLDVGSAAAPPLLDGLLETVVSGSVVRQLTSLQLRANLLTPSLCLLSALHSLTSLDLANSYLPDPSFLYYFVSATFQPLLPSLLYFDASECTYDAHYHRQSVSSFMAFIEAYRQLHCFGCLFNTQMTGARLLHTALSVLSVARTLELPCEPYMRNYDNDEEDDEDEADSYGSSTSSPQWLTIPAPLCSLHTLSLRSSSLTDSSLMDVVCACPALTHLLLLDSKELTTVSLLVLARCSPQLRVLELSGPNVKFVQGAWREAASTQPLLAHLIPSPSAATTPPSTALPSSASQAASATSALSPAGAEGHVAFPALESVTLECPYTSQLDSIGLSTLVAMLQPSPLHTLTIELPCEDSAAFYLLHLAPLLHLRCLSLAPTWNSSGLRRQRSSGVVHLLEQCTEARRLDRVQWEQCVASEWDSGRLDVRTESVDGEDSVWWQMGVESAGVGGLERVFARSSGENGDGREVFFQRLQVCP